MPLFKNKDHAATKHSTAATFPSIIVIDGYKIRPVKKASTIFQNSIFFVSLKLNIVCSFSEMFDAAKAMLKIWRSILNEDVKYQQKLGNIPSFVGVRHVCFAAAATGDFMPYLCLEMDNIQAAAFIARNWCKRTGQLPHSICYAVEDKNKQTHAHHIEYHKASPFLIELYYNRYKCELLALKFGAAVEVLPKNKEYEKDVLPIQGVRCSQSFGKAANVHARRKLKEIYQAKAEGTLERLRKKNKTAAEIEYRRAKKELQYSHISRSEYGAKEIYHYHNRYVGARDKLAYEQRSFSHLLPTDSAFIQAETGLKQLTNYALNELHEVDVKAASRLGIELPANAITIEAVDRIAEKTRQLRRESREANQAAAIKIEQIRKLKGKLKDAPFTDDKCHVEIKDAKVTRNPQQRRRLKEAAINAASRDTNLWANANVTTYDVDAAISHLKSIANEVEVSADGQITIKF